jgi:hypothetical protein
MSPRILTGEALAEWLIGKLIGPGDKVVANPAALDETRRMLAATKELRDLRASAEALAATAAYLGGERGAPAVGNTVLEVINELKPRFEAAIAQRRMDQTDRAVVAARDGKDRLGVVQPAAVVSDRPIISANRFRAFVAG